MEGDTTGNSITPQHDLRLMTEDAASWTPSLNYTLPVFSLIAVVLVIFIIVTALGNLLVAIALYR